MQVTVRRTVRHPPETVFAFAAAHPGLGDEAEHVTGHGLGARHRHTARIGPHEVVTESVVTQWDPPRLLAWRTEHPALVHEASMRFTPHRGGTRIVQTDRETWTHAPWWIRWRGRWAVRRELQRRLARLEQALDKHAA